MITEENLKFKRYLGEESWIKIYQVDSKFIIFENSMGSEFVQDKEFDSLDLALKYASEVC